MTSDPFGFGLAPLKNEGRIYSYELGRELTPEEEVIERQRAAEEAQAKAAYDRSWRGRVDLFFAAVKRAYVAFKNEDTGL